MNLFALLAVAFGTSTIVLLYACIAVADTNKLLRAINDELMDASNELIIYHDALARRNAEHSAHAAELTTVASALRDECRLLELRNAYLESMFINFKGVLAGARLMAPSTLDTGERMTVRNGEMP